MPLVKYTGRETAVAIAANQAIVVVPAIADMLAPKVTEVEAATSHAIQCGIKTFGVVPADSTQTEQYLCDKIATETSGAVRYSMEELRIVAGDPQAANSLQTLCVPGAVLFILDRRGLAEGAAFVAAQKVSTVKVQVTYFAPAPTGANENGDKFEYVAKFAVLGYEPFAVLAA